MAWLSVNKKGHERIHENKPTFDGCEFCDMSDYEIEGESGVVFMDIDLPNGTIEKIIGRKLTFNESPIEF